MKVARRLNLMRGACIAVCLAVGGWEVGDSSEQIGIVSHEAVPELLQPVIERRPVVQNNTRFHSLSIDRIYKAAGDSPRVIERATIHAQDAAPYAGSGKERDARRLSSEDGFRFSGHLRGVNSSKTTQFYFLFQFGLGSIAEHLAAKLREGELPTNEDRALDLFVAGADGLSVFYWDCRLNQEVGGNVPLGSERAVQLFGWLASRASLRKGWKEHRPAPPGFVQEWLASDGTTIRDQRCSKKRSGY